MQTFSVENYESLCVFVTLCAMHYMTEYEN